MQTLALSPELEALLAYTERGISVFFAAEYAARWYSVSLRPGYLTRPSSLIDLISFLRRSSLKVLKAPSSLGSDRPCHRGLTRASPAVWVEAANRLRSALPHSTESQKRRRHARRALPQSCTVPTPIAHCSLLQPAQAWLRPDDGRARHTQPPSWFQTVAWCEPGALNGQERA